MLRTEPQAPAGFTRLIRVAQENGWHVVACLTGAHCAEFLRGVDRLQVTASNRQVTAMWHTHGRKVLHRRQRISTQRMLEVLTSPE